jgi:glycine betaine/choline ABC-type transport system substrate-binding protein
MKKRIALFTLAPATVLLMAAGVPPYSRTDPGFGQTVENNIVGQVIDMTPEYAGVPLEGSNGKRSTEAYRRYQAGNVKKLLSVTGDAAVGQQGGATDTVVVTPAPSN